MIAALILLHQEAVQVAEASLKGGLLSQLIQRDIPHEAALADQALRYGLDLTAEYRMLVLEAGERSSQKHVALYRRINRLVDAHEWQAVVGQFAGQIVVLIQDDSGIDRLLADVLEQIGPTVRVGISGVQRGAGCAASAHQHSLDALHITNRLQLSRQVARFDDLGYLHALYQAGTRSLEANPFVPRLRRLLKEQQADLFHTLEVYLDAGGNGVATSDLLTIHRSTLNYRLARIAEVCEVDLGEALARTNLQVALKLMRLFEVG